MGLPIIREFTKHMDASFSGLPALSRVCTLGSQSGRENTSLRGARVAIGPRKHVTSKGPGCNRTEKTRHFEEDPGGSKGGTTGFARKV